MILATEDLLTFLKTFSKDASRVCWGKICLTFQRISFMFAQVSIWIDFKLFASTAGFWLPFCLKRHFTGRSCMIFRYNARCQLFFLISCSHHKILYFIVYITVMTFAWTYLGKAFWTHFERTSFRCVAANWATFAPFRDVQRFKIRMLTRLRNKTYFTTALIGWGGRRVKSIFIMKYFTQLFVFKFYATISRENSDLIMKIPEWFFEALS